MAGLLGFLLHPIVGVLIGLGILCMLSSFAATSARWMHSDSITIDSMIHALGHQIDQQTSECIDWSIWLAGTPWHCPWAGPAVMPLEGADPSCEVPGAALLFRWLFSLIPGQFFLADGCQ